MSDKKYKKFYESSQEAMRLLEESNQQLDAQQQQLLAANQQLIAQEQQLRASNQQLESESAYRKQAQLRLDLALKASNTGLWDWEIETNKLYLSPTYYTMLGYEVDEFPAIYELWWNLLHPDDLEMTEKALGSSVEGGDLFEIEFRLKDKDGSWHWIHSKGNIVEFDANNKSLRMTGTNTDITERKQAAEALQVSEKRFRDIAESMSDWVWEVDANAVYTYCSSRVESVLGYREDEIIGKSPFDFISPDEVERVGEIFGAIVKDKKPFRDLENWNITKDGQRVCMLTSGVPIVGDDGELLGYRGVDSDVTERKQAVETLQESEEKYRDLFTKMTNGFAYQEIVLGENGRPVDYIFLEVNEAFEKQTGLKRADLIGKRVTEVLPGIENDSTDWIGICGKVALTGEHIQFESYSAPLNKWYSNYIYSAGNGRFVDIFEDITDRKHAEESLRRANEVVNQSPVVAFVWKNEEGWPVEYCSENVERMFGYSSEDFVSGKVLYSSVVHPEDLPHVGEEVSKATEDASVEMFTHDPYRIITNDKDIIWVEDITTIHRDADGTIVTYEGILLDITERMASENKLQKTLAEIERFNSLMEGREVRVIEMKKEVNALLVELGRDPQYQSVIEKNEAISTGTLL